MSRFRLCLAAVAIVAVMVALASCAGGQAPSPSPAPVDWPDNYVAPDVIAKYPTVPKGDNFTSEGVPEVPEGP